MALGEDGVAHLVWPEGAGVAHWENGDGQWQEKAANGQRQAEDGIGAFQHRGQGHQ